MKEVNFETFKEWIDSEFPEIALMGPMSGSSIGENFALTLVGCDGPSVNEKGIETANSIESSVSSVPWDFHVKEIEWKAQDLLEGDGTDGLDFKEEAEALLEVAKKVRKKLIAAGRKDSESTDDYVYGEYPNGIKFILIPWKPKYIDDINKIVFDYFNSIVDYMDEDELSGKEKRKTYREFLG